MRCKAPESGNQTAACVQNHTELTFLTERNPKNLCVQKRPGELLLGIFAKIDFVYSLRGAALAVPLLICNKGFPLFCVKEYKVLKDFSRLSNIRLIYTPVIILYIDNSMY